MFLIRSINNFIYSSRLYGVSDNARVDWVGEKHERSENPISKTEGMEIVLMCKMKIWLKHYSLSE